LATKLGHRFKNKKILVTAGPTSVPIDNVRVISNTATGETGILLAEKLQRLGAKVTLLLGPVRLCRITNRIKLVHFKFFDELKNLIKKELGSKQYDIVIHSAAVSDYRPKTYYRHKVKSGKKLWRLALTMTPKIIDSIKKFDPSLFLVGFKFEPQSPKGELINKAKILIRHSQADLVVANTIYNGRYDAYIVSQGKVSNAKHSRNELVKTLIAEIANILCGNSN
jgi:phosphopantothenoylcysteine decarboxylase/phosphopantothenate--cysteine ligase